MLFAAEADVEAGEAPKSDITVARQIFLYIYFGKGGEGWDFLPRTEGGRGRRKGTRTRMGDNIFDGIWSMSGTVLLLRVVLSRTGVLVFSITLRIVGLNQINGGEERRAEKWWGRWETRWLCFCGCIQRDVPTCTQL